LTTKIGEIEEHSPAWEAGLKVGDEIKLINGKEVRRWVDIERAIRESSFEEMEVVLLRSGQRMLKKIRPIYDEQREGVTIGILVPFISTEIGRVQRESPAEKAGLKKGDLIIALNEIEVERWRDAAEIIHQSKEKPLTLKLSREGKILVKEVQPDIGWDMDETGNPVSVGVIGISPKIDMERVNILAALKYGVISTWNGAQLTIVVFKRLVTREYSVKILGGPVALFQMVGYMGRFGIQRLIELVAFISIMLGIINLFPLPILDGGHILFITIEKLRGRPISAKKQELAQQIGAILLIGFMLFVTFNDVERIIKKKLIAKTTEEYREEKQDSKDK